MSKVYIDPNIAQTGLDSGALTMLGAVVRRFEEPGEYRGTVRRGDAIEKVFYLSVDKESPVAGADIDLAKLAGSLPQQEETGRDCCPGEGEAAAGRGPTAVANWIGMPSSFSRDGAAGPPPRGKVSARRQIAP
jgi:hypothetical protein